MKKRIIQWMCCIAALSVATIQAENVYDENGGLVVMEMENTKSPLQKWQLISSGTEGYPAGAIGAGHLEYSGSETWGVPECPLAYLFRINKPGKYHLQFRAHKRLEGEKGDKCNDCFVNMAGDYAPGRPDIPLPALQSDQKLFGGAADAWGLARTLDLKLHKFGIKTKKKSDHRKPAVYEFKAGETYTLTVSGRAKRYNLDRIVLNHESLSVKNNDLATLPESRTIPRTSAKKNQSEVALEAPDGRIDLTLAPEEKFDGRIFLINDWDGGDKDNQNAAEELNRNSKIKQDMTVLSDLPNRNPRKVDVDDLVKDAKVLADASKKGKIALAMGAHSRHVLAWLTKLPKDAYNHNNIVLVTHSNWNELDGRAGYEANKKPGDPPLGDTHGIDLRRGLYPSLAKISDLGVIILEIPRTDSGPGGWGGRVAKSDGDTAAIKVFDISDLGLVHYLKTGVVEATRLQRNEFVSDILKKPETLDNVNGELITRYWDNNRDVPGEKEDYLPGGKYYE